MAEQTIEGDRVHRFRTPPMKRHQNHHIRELVIHTVAFFLAAAVGAAILWHYYWFFEWNTDDPSGARDAYFASVAVVGGFGPAITTLFLWLRKIGR
jgi:hypothetical protein